MNFRHGKSKEEEVNFWRVMGDLLLGLLFVILLILMLLLTIVLDIPEEEEPGDGYTEAYSTEETVPYDDWYEEHIDDDDGGGGGGGEWETVPETFPTDDIPQEYNGKSAVYVVVRDSETMRTVQLPDITFELYRKPNRKMILNCYYPNRIAFEDYSTTPQGVFYFPEKLWEGSYYLVNTGVPEGYEPANDVFFEVLDPRDWDDPYIVYADLNPSKNRICLQVKDQETGEGLPGGSFRVVAAEDIVTSDGTIRCKKGEDAGLITCDETGYGESEELYLGSYEIRQDGLPFGYAVISEDPVVDVRSKSAESISRITEIITRKSAVTFVLSDELDNAGYLQGVSYRVASGTGEFRDFETDRKGMFTVTDLQKDTEYTVSQLTQIGDYQPDPNTYSFYVDSRGLINGEALSRMTLYGRVIRVYIGVTGKILPRLLKDTELELLDAEGNVAETWISSGEYADFTSIRPGEYTLREKGSFLKEIELSVKDSKEIQTFRYQIWTETDYLIICGGILILAAVITLTAAALRKKYVKKGRDTNE